MKLFAFTIHVLINYFLGKSALPFLSNHQKDSSTFFIALLLGILLETTICFLILWLGGNPLISLLFVIVLIVLLQSKHISFSIKEKKVNLPVLKPMIDFLRTLKWYEWFLSLLILEKVLFILWQLFRIPTFFSDDFI